MRKHKKCLFDHLQILLCPLPPIPVLLIQSLVRSRIDYGLIVYGSASNTHPQKMQHGRRPLVAIAK
jgi:hypothetical protein